MIRRAVTAAIAASSPSNTRAGPGVRAALVAGELDDAALGREVAAQDREAAGRLERVVERRARPAGPRVSCASSAMLADGLAGDRVRVRVQDAEPRAGA